MRKSYLILAALALGSTLLAACGHADTTTTTPSSTLGTDSAATKVGGIPATDTAGVPSATTPGQAR